MGSLVSEGASLVNPRRRRETLSELVPDVVQYPLDLLQRSVDTARNFATDQIGSIAGRMVSAAWNIVTTVVIPWLHRAAEQLEKSNDLPATLRTLLGDFDYAYTIFQTLGYIGPKDS
ncbi:hypothetical protein WH47_11228 [Habropoda laboriosa]|uniref:Uncharacterized protein n=2 Tax=Habropoda laboriosa TaxID=597456 RepID=A0A0L7QKK0_9HYME|nr:hypothetical protein WH47_11228 [Habropoda laboriosa]